LDYSLEELLAQAWDFSEQDRWKDYEMVTDRLNSPVLLNYYERVTFIYEIKEGTRIDPYTYAGSPKRLFKSNRGFCIDVSAFTAYCLQKGGYKVWERDVNPSWYHLVCFFEDNGKEYILDNGRPDKFLRRGIIPSKEYEMYHDQKNSKKGGTENHKDPVFQLQDNYALTLVYLIENKSRSTSIKTISKDLGGPGRFETNVTKGIKALVESGFITITPYEDAKLSSFTYKINEPLCKRFLKERYNKQQNKYPWVDGVNRGYYSSLK